MPRPTPAPHPLPKGLWHLEFKATRQLGAASLAQRARDKSRVLTWTGMLLRDAAQLGCAPRGGLSLRSRSTWEQPAHLPPPVARPFLGGRGRGEPIGAGGGGEGECRAPIGRG